MQGKRELIQKAGLSLSKETRAFCFLIVNPQDGMFWALRSSSVSLGCVFRQHLLLDRPFRGFAFGAWGEGLKTISQRVVKQHFLFRSRLPCRCLLWHCCCFSRFGGESCCAFRLFFCIWEHSYLHRNGKGWGFVGHRSRETCFGKMGSGHLSSWSRSCLHRQACTF